ncbi:hypothetical protein C8R44DRAFT_855401 [Mycena epipterygia]|nr:hypothetical protein C8R44DRAFT_855401 [Mycena epipterygia]
MPSVTRYYDSFKHPGRKYAAWVDTLSPSDLQRLEADLRRQDKDHTALSTTVFVTSVVSHGILAPVGAAAELAVDYRRGCARDKLVVVREAMEARRIPRLPETSTDETLATDEKSTDAAGTESLPAIRAEDAKPSISPHTVPQVSSSAAEGSEQRMDPPQYHARARGEATSSRPRSHTVTRGGKAAVEEVGRVVGDAVNWAKDSVARHGGAKGAVEDVGRVVGDGMRWAKDRVQETSLRVTAPRSPSRPPSRGGGKVALPASAVPAVPPLLHGTRIEARPQEVQPPAYYVGTPSAKPTPQPEFYTVGKRVGKPVVPQFQGTANDAEVYEWNPLGGTIPQSFSVRGV